MRKILTLSAVAAAALSVSACSSPDKCIDDLDCGTGAYSEERTVKVSASDTYKVSAPIDESAMPEPTPEPEPAPAPAPVEANEPIQGTADTMFDSRLTK